MVTENAHAFKLFTSSRPSVSYMVHLTTCKYVIVFHVLRPLLKIRVSYNGPASRYAGMQYYKTVKMNKYGMVDLDPLRLK